MTEYDAPEDEAPTADPTGLARLDEWPDDAGPPPMSIEEARALIAAKNNVSVADDDPILLLVTLHQGFAADYEKLMARHAKALAGFMEQTGDRTAEAVGKVLAVLQDEVLEGALRHTLARISEEAALASGFMNSLEALSDKLTRRLAFLAGLAWLAVALTLGAVFFVLTK